jgi:hypothetical protein
MPGSYLRDTPAFPGVLFETRLWTNEEGLIYRREGKYLTIISGRMEQALRVGRCIVRRGLQIVIIP